jgi:hypothetical protein
MVSRNESSEMINDNNKTEKHENNNSIYAHIGCNRFGDGM